MMCGIKGLVKLHTILCILSYYAYGEKPPPDPDTSATLKFNLKKNSCSNLETLLEGEPARVNVSSLFIDYVIYQDKEIPRKELTPSASNEKVFEIEVPIEDITPGIKNYTFLIQHNLSGVATVPYGKNAKDLYRPVYCAPTFHVRLKETPVTIAINDVELTTVRTNLSVTDYDAVAYYKFRQGELVDISCGERSGEANIAVQYRGMESTLIRYNEKSEVYTVRFQVKLESKDSGSYLTCKIEMKNDYAIVRVYLLLDDDPEDDITIRINGFKLRRQLTSGLNNGDIQNISFFYKFMAGETVEVACEKRAGSTGVLSFNPGVKAKCMNNDACVTVQILTQNLNLYCNYDYGNGSTLMAKIRLYDDMQDFYIDGIPLDNIKYRYAYNREDIPITQFVYEYSDGDVLNLTCKGKEPAIIAYSLHWNFMGEDVSMDKTSVQAKLKPNAYTFGLNSDSINNGNGELKCLVYDYYLDTKDMKTIKNRTYNIISLKLTKRTTETTTALPMTSSTEKGSGPDTVPENKEPLRMPMIVGIGVGLCILILIMSLMVYSISKRKPHRKRDSNINYENLSHNRNNTLTNPTQWNEEQYARPVDLREDTETYSVPINQTNCEELYAQPQPKALRKKNNTKETNNYVNLEPTYSEVRRLDVKDCNDPNYSQVVPKSMRNNLKVDNESNYANTTDSSNYAEVLPKNKRKNVKKEGKCNYVLPKDGSKYAEIAPECLRKPGDSSNYVNVNNESNYAEVVHSINNRNKYVNVIPNNEPYVNANSSDYAEPAYCELNIKNNKK